MTKRQRYKCKKCSMIISSVNSHLVNTHDFDGHTIYEMEEFDYWSWKDLVKEWFDPTEEPFAYFDGNGKLRSKKI